MYFRETIIFNEKDIKRITDFNIKEVNEKYAIVSDPVSGLCGVVSLDGKTIIEARYSNIEFLSDNLFKLYDLDMVGVFNDKSQIIIPIKYNFIFDKKGQLYALNNNDAITNIYDYSGKKINTINSSNIEFTTCNLLVVHNRFQKTLVDKDGNEVLDLSNYLKYIFISDDRIVVEKEKKATVRQYLIDLKENKIISLLPHITDVEPLDDKTLLLTNDKYNGALFKLCDYDGHIIRTLGRYDDILDNGKGYLVAVRYSSKRNSFRIFNYSGDEVIIPENLLSMWMTSITSVAVCKSGEFCLMKHSEPNIRFAVSDNKVVNIEEEYEGINKVVDVSHEETEQYVIEWFKDYTKNIYLTNNKKLIHLGAADKVFLVDDNRLIINNCLYSVDDLDDKNVKIKLEVCDDDNNIKYSKVLDTDADVELYKKIIQTEVNRGIEISSKIAQKRKAAIDEQDEKNKSIIMNNIETIVEKTKKKIR